MWMKWLPVHLGTMFCRSLPGSDSDDTDGWSIFRASLPITHRLPFPNENFQLHFKLEKAECPWGWFSFKIYCGILE